jgi:hypothetical protein
MVVKILNILQWVISRKPTKLHTLNFNKKYFHKKRKKKKTKYENFKITHFSLKLKNKTKQNKFLY